MRKVAVLAMTGLLLVVAAVAYAQVTNTYTVTASTNPAKAGSSKKPVPISVKFNYQVGEVDGKRPSPVKKYSILFDGLRVNTNSFPKCSAAQLKASKAGCAAAKVGSGAVRNASGATNNPNDKSIVCDLQLTVYNSGNNKGLLLLEGGPGQGAGKECPIEFGPSNGTIPANYARSARGTALEFSVPATLLHPLATLDNSVYDVRSTILKKTKKVKGKTVGYYEAVGGCRGGRRTVTVTFTPETGSTQKASSPAKCS